MFFFKGRTNVLKLGVYIWMQPSPIFKDGRVKEAMMDRNYLLEVVTTTVRHTNQEVIQDIGRDAGSGKALDYCLVASNSRGSVFTGSIGKLERSEIVSGQLEELKRLMINNQLE
jgi:hypothetical protein